MHRQLGLRAPRAAPRDGGGVDFVSTGFAAVITAVSFLNLSTVGVGAGAGDEAVVTAVDPWQVILAFAMLVSGLLCVMHGMRLRGARGARARAPALVRRAARAAAAVLWNAAGGPERLVLPLLLLLLCPILEAWLDLI